jgi:alkanesulfonate monooxygenase SsuD/methylene tetrahydromethanopterin reductase-like flavin-dependent oxidoreductase (luciferase family)
MRHPLRFGLKLSGQDTTVDALRTVWRVADEAGFDHVWDFDHMASIGPGGPDRPVYEGWALQAAMAVATRRVRFGCNVTGNTYRHPGQLAKLAVTVDHLSGGRLEFGIGAAWAEIEHTMLGLDGLDHRVGRLSESLRIIKSLWTQDRTTFQGRYYQLTDAIANPKPIQQPHPPIWIGAGGDLMIRLVARHADVWNPSGAARGERMQEVADKLEAECGAIGRDPASIRRCTILQFDGSNRGQLVDSAGQALEQGFTEQIIGLSGPDAGSAAGIAAEALADLRTLAA